MCVLLETELDLTRAKTIYYSNIFNPLFAMAFEFIL